MSKSQYLSIQEKKSSAFNDFSIYLNERNGVLEEGVWTVLYDRFEGSLNHSIGSHESLTQLVQSISNLGDTIFTVKSIKRRIKRRRSWMAKKKRDDIKYRDSGQNQGKKSVKSSCWRDTLREMSSQNIFKRRKMPSIKCLRIEESNEYSQPDRVFYACHGQSPNPTSCLGSKTWSKKRRVSLSVIDPKWSSVMQHQECCFMFLSASMLFTCVTSYLLVVPLQDRTGTSVVREAIGRNFSPGNTMFS